MISLIKIDRNNWNKHWHNVQHAPLVQSWEYGEAKCRSQHFIAHRFLLQDEKNTPVALLQVLVYSLPLIGGAARINRGPVFFSDSLHISPSTEEVKQVMTAVRDIANCQRWRIVRIAPEFLLNDELIITLTDIGFRKNNVPPATSAVIDITPSPEQIRSSFHSKWRNLLKKSEKMNLELETPPLRDALPFLIHEYEKMQLDKNFKGISTKLLRQMTEQEGPSWNCRILFAIHEGERHGMVMVVGHGDTCTYLIGWTSEEGRKLQVNYFLLWQSMLLFRNFGYRFFDVGGLGVNTTAGVEHFKKGLKGEEYSLVGEFSYSTIPFLK
jgi:lipid II:glycine glycyltransferase (peptidoglycan interpeptide bridge formation enzyme)